MKLYKIEHTHTVTDIYYVEAENKREAEHKFMNDPPEVEETINEVCTSNYKITETEHY